MKYGKRAAKAHTAAITVLASLLGTYGFVVPPEALTQVNNIVTALFVGVPAIVAWILTYRIPNKQ